jgi:peptide/nickel transport system substrate-binding protein
MRRFLAVCAVLGTLSTPAFAGKADDTLNAAFLGEVATLDNYKETGREGLILARLIYDSLLSKDFATGGFKPELAESYKIVDDKTIDFELRKNVKFHDGEPMTADDVVYTLNLVSSKDYNARYQIAVSWIESAEKLGDYSVRLHMKAPNPLALEMLAGNLPIYPKAYYEKVGTAGMGVKPVGTGPYKLVDAIPGSRYVFERFDDYYAGSPKGAARIKRLIVRILPEANTQYAELLNGGLDWIWRVPPDDAKNLARRPNVEVQQTEIMRFAYIAFNPNFDGGKSPLADVRVRRAMNYAVNRAAIVRALIGKVSRVMTTPCFPKQFGCTTDVAKYDYDPAKAKTLLAEAGYPNGFSTELVVSAMPRIQAEAISADLAKVSIKVAVNEQQYAPATTSWREGRSQMVMRNWGSYGVADSGLSTGQYFSGNPDDIYRDPELVGPLLDANSSPDQARRDAIYQAAAKRVADQAYWLPLWSYNVTTAQNKDLEITMNPDEFVDFFRAHWK